MKSYILLLGLLLGGFTAYADSTAKKETEAILIGHVVDSRSGEHLPFITITVKGTTIGTTTDVSGHYLLGNLPVGRPLTVVAQSVGYKSAERSVTLGAHSTTELNFELEEQAVDVGEVVVEIDRNSVIRKETPSLVNILNSKLFERTNAATLADGLSFQPGVRVEDGCQNCGFAQVRINGLDGHYSQILLDSRPLFSALNGVYGLEQIPANMIERVEVIRGGGSALFGASAIGGTINIITKEPLRDWAEIGHTLMSVGCSGAYDNNTTINASLVSNNRKAGIYVYGQNRYRSGYDHDGDGYTELPNLRNQMFGMRSYLRTGDHSKLTLEYHGINEFRRGGNRLDLPAHEANITEQTDHNINGASVAFDLFSRDDRTRHLSVYSAVQQTTRKSYYGGTGEGATDEELENARKAYGRTDGLTVISGAQFLQRFERLLFLPSELTLGVEHSYDHIDDVTIGYDMRTNQKVHILSGVIQNEWKARKWSFLLGGRFDHHNMVDHVIFSPRINLRYNPTEQINLRLNYAGGFRAHRRPSTKTCTSPSWAANAWSRSSTPTCARSVRTASAPRSTSTAPSAAWRPTCSSKASTPHSTISSPRATCPNPTKRAKRCSNDTTAAERPWQASTSRRRRPSPAGSTCRPASHGSAAATNTPSIGATTRPTNAACSVRPTGTAT